MKFTINHLRALILEEVAPHLFHPGQPSCSILIPTDKSQLLSLHHPVDRRARMDTPGENYIMAGKT